VWVPKPSVPVETPRPAAGYDQRAERPFEFIPVWGFLVFLLYRMRRVHSKTCGVVVEEVPSADGKHYLTKAYMLFFGTVGTQTVLERKRPIVPHHVGQGLPHRAVCRGLGLGTSHPGPISALGVDEIQYVCRSAAGPKILAKKPSESSSHGCVLQ
jgi:hypothetical protein